MAAVTESSRNETFTSNRRIVTAQIVAAATADTWATGLSVIDWWAITPTTDVGDVFASVSGGTVTVGYDGGGGATFRAIAIGT